MHGHGIRRSAEISLFGGCALRLCYRPAERPAVRRIFIHASRVRMGGGSMVARHRSDSAVHEQSRLYAACVVGGGIGKNLAVVDTNKVAGADARLR